MEKSFIKAALLSLILTGILNSPAHAQTMPRDYRDWSMSCSNIASCTAISVSSLNELGVGRRPRGISSETEMGWLWLEVAAGPNARPQITYSGASKSETSLPANSNLRIVGNDGRTITGGQFALTSDGGGNGRLRSTDVDRFIARAKLGNAVVYTSGPRNAVQSFASLSGFVASLRAIEVVQRRTGTAGAWVDTGKAARERIPAAPALPRVNAVAFTKVTGRTAIPKVLFDRRTADCDDSERLDPGARGIEGFNLGRGRVLWAVPCGAGAYNVWTKFYVQQGSNSLVPNPFPGPERDATNEDAHSLVNASTTPEKGQISTFAKARGIGDCGSAETFTWDGTRFVLTELLQMNACGGVPSDFWPELIKTEVVLPPTKTRR